MSTTSFEMTTTRRDAWATRLRDMAELTKPRIVTLVLFTVAIAGWVAAWGQPNPLLLLHAVIGTVLIAASGSILNQCLERDTDSMMPRTADRPVATGRLGMWEAVGLATVTGTAGLAYLLTTTNLQAAWWGLCCWLLYVVAYTPLKRRSSWNTTVGALSGAMPIWIGWTAVGAPLDTRAAALFLVVFLWQFPHFMAIAWLYRKQYGRAGILVSTVVDPTGRAAGVQAVLGAVCLLPVTFVLGSFDPDAAWYLVGSCVLGIGQLTCAWRFLRHPDDVSARILLRASLIYLPVLLILLGMSP